MNCTLRKLIVTGLHAKKLASGKPLNQREETLNQSLEVFSDVQTWSESPEEHEHKEQTVGVKDLPRETTNIHNSPWDEDPTDRPSVC